MLKKLSILLLFVGFTANSNAQIKTPQPSPAAKLEQVVGLTDVTLEYSRPAMRGRTIFGDLVPYGETWRTGANANTKITFSDNVTIDGQELAKGTYAIFTIPNETSWEVIFYSDSNNWGTPQKWDDSKVAAKTTVEVHEMPMPIDSFTMSIDDLKTNSAAIGIMWENVYVGVTFEVPTDKITSKSIENVMAGPSGNDYFQAASYYHTEGKDLKQALAWMKKATEGDNPPFWYLRRMSLIQADMGDKAGAIATAKKSLEGAIKAGNKDYEKMNQESISEWQN
mgnify:CR=1 FL=1|jgi:hypothetical protein